MPEFGFWLARGLGLGGSAEAEIPGFNFTRSIDREREPDYWGEEQFWGKGSEFRAHWAHCPAARNQLTERTSLVPNPESAIFKRLRSTRRRAIRRASGTIAKNMRNHATERSDRPPPIDNA